MSRNFELLRQVQRERTLLQTVQSLALTNSRNFEVLRQAHRDQGLFEEPGAGQSSTELEQPRPNGPYDSQTFKLVQQLFLTPGVLAPKVVVFCGVGKTSEPDWTCARVAQLLGSVTTDSLCIVDTNLERPLLHKYFEVENRFGLADILLEARSVKDVALTIEGRHSYLLTAGLLPVGVDPNATLTSHRMRERMIELQGIFRYVMVEAPPAMRGSVTAHLAALSDGAVLVLEPGFTPRESVLAAKEEIEAAGGKVLGVVLHRRGLPFMDRKQKSPRNPR